MSKRAGTSVIVVEFLAWVDREKAIKLLGMLGLELVLWRASRLTRVKVPVGEEDVWVARMNGDHGSFIKKASRAYMYLMPDKGKR